MKEGDRFLQRIRKSRDYRYFCELFSLSEFNPDGFYWMLVLKEERN